MDFFAQRCQVRVGGAAFGYWEAHSSEHSVFFGLFQFALFLGKLLGGGLLFVSVVFAFGIPVEIAALLPAAHS